MPSTTDWVLFVIATIFAIVICGIILRYAFNFYRFRHSQALQKRYPFLVGLQTLCFVLYIGFMHTFHKLAFLYGTIAFDIDEYDHSKQLGNIFFITSMFFYSFSIHGIVLLMLARLWLIYFEIQWCVESENSQWMIHINADSVSSFWFIKHRKDYGSYKYVYTFITVYYLIEAVVLFLVMISTQDIGRSVDVFILFIEMITIAVIWCKFPQMHDAFAIKEETQYILRLAFVGIIIYLIWTVKIMVSGHYVVDFFIFGLLFEILTGSMALILNGYIFRDKYKYLLDETHELDTKQHSVTLRDTLSTKKLVDAFFQHLSSEFSVELLLSYIEFTQFRLLMLNDADFMNDINYDQLQKKSYFCDTVLSQDIPQSHIVLETDENMSSNIAGYLITARDLYTKYIDHGAEFEINISFTCHNDIKSFINTYCYSGAGRQLNDVNKSELFSLFERARHTLLRLMQSSHYRFIQSKYYTSIAGAIQIEKVEPLETKYMETVDNAESEQTDDLHTSLIDMNSENPLEFLVLNQSIKSAPVQKKGNSLKLTLKKIHSTDDLYHDFQ